MSQSQWDKEIKNILKNYGIEVNHAADGKLYSTQIIMTRERKVPILQTAKAKGLQLSIDIYEFNKPPEDSPVKKGPLAVFYQGVIYVVNVDGGTNYSLPEEPMDVPL